MKKTTTFRQSALVGAPSVASGFVPSISNAIKISVNLRNVDIKIYGFNGSQWELLHDTDGLTNSYVTDVVHQKYYFESKTGVEQTVSASFLSSDSRNIEQPRFGVSRDTRKLHDIEEVPLYNSEDAGKFLTVMSNGSLAWLLETESYIVGDEGGGEENQTQPGYIVGLEEDAGLTLHGNAQLIDGILHFDGATGTYASLPHSTDYDRGNGDLTISMWFKANSLPSNWNAGLVSKMGSGWQGYITAVTTMDGLTDGGLQTSTWINGGSNPNNRTSVSGGITLDEWHHVAYVMVETGYYKMYFNGQEVESYNPTYRNTSTTGDLRIGGWQNGSYHGYFDGQIEGIKIEKSARSAAAILEEYTSGAPSSETPTVAAGIESLETNTLSGDAQQTTEGLLITNDGYADTQSNYHNGATEQTISAWFKASELGTVTGNTDTQWRDNGHVIAITRDYASMRRANGFVIAVASNKIRFSGPHQSNTVVSPNYDFSVDTWYKIDMTWTSNSMKFYVNGALVGSASPSGSIAGGAKNLRIGRNINSWMSFKGNILGVTVENVAKSDGEILTSYQSQA